MIKQQRYPTKNISLDLLGGKIEGYFGIGIQCCKTGTNYGTLYHTTNLLKANFLFLIGIRFKK